MKLNFDFTKEQLAEFEKAEQFDGSLAEIRKHPEWHPNFMNAFWNAERDGRAEEYYMIADYIASYPSVKDMEAGKIGADFDYLYALHKFVDKAKSGDIPEVPLDGNGCVDTEMAKFVLQDYICRHIEPKERLYTGRMSIDINGSMDEVRILMCEGNSKAAAIYNQLTSAARSEARVKTPFDGLSMQDSRMWNSYTSVLSLDDMNIRGQQIVDAYEYAGGSVETMLNLLEARDSKMVGYVNQKCAERYLADDAVFSPRYGIVKYPMSKTHGASFAYSGHFNADRDWDIDILNAEELANAGISPIKVDYSALDITEGVDAQTGFQIIEAHGFEKYFGRTVKDIFGDDLQTAFFYNKQNGAIIEVSGAKEDSITYGGATLKVWQDEENWHHGMHSSSGFEEDAGLGYNEFTYHNGLFREYGAYEGVSVSKQLGRSKLKYQGLGDIPIPDYIRFSCRDEELADKLQDKKNFTCLNSNVNYQLGWMIDMMLAAHDPELREDICPDYKRLKEDPYHSVMKRHGGVAYYNSIEHDAHLFQFAASWMHMPTEEREKYYNALVDVAGEHDRKMVKMAKERGERVDKNALCSKDVRKISKLYLKDPKCPEDIYVVGIPRIEDTPFAKFVPWLDTEAQEFEAAVAGIPMDFEDQLGK